MVIFYFLCVYLGHAKHIRLIRVLTGSYRGKSIPNQPKKCVLFNNFFRRNFEYIILYQFSLNYEKRFFLFSYSFDFLCLFVQLK